MKISMSMGRPRQDMVDLVKSCQDVVQEHLWKLYAYHSIRQNDVAGWLETLNKYLPKLSTYNVQKNSATRKNLNRSQLLDKFVVELFEDADIRVQNKLWANKGFPKLDLTEQNCSDLRKLAERFVDCILTEAEFSASSSELY